MSKVLLKNGYVYTNEGIGKADVLLSADRLFLDFSENDLENTTVYNIEGKLIVPGFVDVHVHLREPGFLYKETVVFFKSFSEKSRKSLSSESNTSAFPIPSFVYT